MSERVYVAAIWSYAHRAWAEFVVSPDAAKVRAVCAPLSQFTATHVRIVSVERDDWELIRPALAALEAPPPSYTAKELELYFEHRRSWSEPLLAACASGKVARFELSDDAPIERRSRVARRVA